MSYWLDEIFRQVNVPLHAPSGAKSRSSINDVHVSHGSAFFPYHSDRMLAKLTWREWIAMRSQSSRLPRMVVTAEYQPKPLKALLEIDEAGNVLLRPDGRLAVVSGR